MNTLHTRTHAHTHTHTHTHTHMQTSQYVERSQIKHVDAPCVGSHSNVLTMPFLLLIKSHTRDVQITHHAHRLFHLSATQVTAPSCRTQTDTKQSQIINEEDTGLSVRRGVKPSTTI